MVWFGGVRGFIPFPSPNVNVIAEPEIKLSYSMFQSDTLSIIPIFSYC